MNKATEHSNDPWFDGVRPIEVNPESRVVRALTVIGKVLAVLFKIAFCLVFAIAKLWAAMDDGRKEKDPMEKAEKEIKRGHHFMMWGYYKARDE